MDNKGNHKWTEDSPLNGRKYLQMKQRQGINLQNIQTAHAAQKKKKTKYRQKKKKKKAQ